MEPDEIDLALYVHVPWCVRKCPYCDFNSHALRGDIPERDFLAALDADLAADSVWTDGREVSSIFIGGGTPSLLSGPTIAQLLESVRTRVSVAADAEVTLEANPGAVDTEHFRAYRQAGVNRLSIGVQSFAAVQLAALGRIHDPEQGLAAFRTARAAGFDNINLDLMFGLPGQSIAAARDDLEQALALGPEHLSYYQLTLEPNTPFNREPPSALPDDDALWEIQEAGLALLDAGGYARYEVSAYARGGRRCRHNLNYWRFGDYLGIGPGAHGKLTPADGAVRRTWKCRHPDAYLRARDDGVFIAGSQVLSEADLRFEFLLNALRLVEGFSPELFECRTGRPFEELEPGLRRARARGWLHTDGGRVRASPTGYAFLNDLLLLLNDGN